MKIVQTKPEKIVLEAVNKAVEFCKPTYGPAGRKNLIVYNEFNHESVDDGKRSLESLESENETENGILQSIKEVVKKGKDGTTTGILIMGAIVNEAYKNIDDPMANKDYHGTVLSLEKGLEEAVGKIKKLSKPAKTKDELYRVAFNAYKNKEIAEIVSDTTLKVGKDGLIEIAESGTTQTSVEVVSGLEFSKGYASPYFLTEEGKSTIRDAKILLVNKRINSLNEVIDLFTSTEMGPMGTQKKFDTTSIVIIADGFGELIITQLASYRVTHKISPLLIELPAVNKQDTLEDIAIITGGKAIDGKVVTLDKATKEYLGSAESIISTTDKTRIINGAGKSKDVKEYVEKLKKVEPTSPFEKDRQEKRVAQLTGGVAIIKLGAYTDSDLKGMKTKAENARNSTQAAFRSGVVPGAGKAFLDIETSSPIINEALKAPRRQLEENGKQYLDENTTDATDIVITALTMGVSIAKNQIEHCGVCVPKRKKNKEDEY